MWKKQTLKEGLSDADKTKLQSLDKQVNMSKTGRDVGEASFTTESQKKSTDQAMHSIRDTLGVSNTTENTRLFVTSIDELFKGLFWTFNQIEVNIIEILTDMSRYDPCEYIASHMAGIISGRIQITSSTVKSYFDGVGVELNDIFTKAHLDAINVESTEIKSPEEIVAHHIIYDFLLFPIMMWVVYNWYYKLFSPIAKCPEMKNYENWYSMVFPGIITGTMVLPLYEMEKGIFSVKNMFSDKYKYSFSIAFYCGTFLAVYYLWVNPGTRIHFEFPSSNANTLYNSNLGNGMSGLNGLPFYYMLIILNVINVIILISDFMTRYPPVTWVLIFLTIVVFCVTLGLSFIFLPIIYIIVILFLTYFSFI
jgi:hypothetical protein